MTEKLRPYLFYDVAISICSTCYRRVDAKIVFEDGKVWMLNVWASWCVACREEHPMLLEFSKLKLVPIYGLNYKDKRPDGQGWLTNFGNPYTASLFDQDGRVGIDFGVYGVPETFIIDKQGVIRMKHIGPLTPEVLRDKIEPMLSKLNA